MFTLKSSITSSGLNADDMVTMNAVLRATGHLAVSDPKHDPLAGPEFYDAIRAFQTKNGLTPTGEISRMDDTHRKMKSVLKSSPQVAAKFYGYRSGYEERADAAEWGEE